MPRQVLKETRVTPHLTAVWWKAAYQFMRSKRNAYRWKSASLRLLQDSEVRGEGMRLINAEFLKLRKRRGLLWGSLFLIVGIPFIIFIILEILHLANPAKYGPPGGSSAFGQWL